MCSENIFLKIETWYPGSKALGTTPRITRAYLTYKVPISLGVYILVSALINVVIVSV